MSKIVLVHGMRMQQYEEEPLRKKWYEAIRALLQRTSWGSAQSGAIPREEDVALVYWADLFKWPDLGAEAAATKGFDLPSLRATYYELCRVAVRIADMATGHSGEGRPDGATAAYLDGLIAQTAVYMHNGPVFHPDPQAGDGAFFQVQARFRTRLTPDTRLVIAHSLGTVVAYEGLCWKPHRVRSLITVGSPLATPDLILKPLRARLARLLGTSPDSLPWPKVDSWTNIYARSDVWCVPVQGLSALFEGRVKDVAVDHGSTFKPSKTHELTAYLEHLELGDAIADALRE